jgi:hypothetical protein
MKEIRGVLISCVDLDMELREILETSPLPATSPTTASQEILRQILEPLGIVRSAKGCWQGAFDKSFLTPRYLETFYAIIIHNFNDYKTYTPKEVIAYIRKILAKERYKLVYWQVGKERIYRYIILNT